MRHPRRSRFDALSRFHHSESGTVAVEYALLLALVVGGILFATDLLGNMAAGSFNRVAAGTGAGHQPAPQSETSEAADPSSFAATHLDAPRPWSKRFQLNGGSIVTLIGGVLLLPLLRSQRKSREQQLLEEHGQQPIEQESPLTFAKREQIYEVLSKNLASIVAGTMQIRHLMTDNLITAAPGDAREDVAELMRQNQMRHVLVCRGEQLLGIISDRDIMNRPGDTAQQIMTPEPVNVGPRTPVIPVVTMMVQRRFSALPVIDEGRLIGLLTSTDLMLALQCSLQMMQRMQNDYAREKKQPAP